MSNPFWMMDARMARLQPFLPKSHGVLRGDDRHVLGGIIFIDRNRLRWCAAPKEYGPPKTLYNRWGNCGDKGIFARMMEGWPAGRRFREPEVLSGASNCYGQISVNKPG